MPGDSPSWPDYRPQSRRRACHSGLSILTDEVHQRCKEHTSDGLRKKVGNHDLARQMLHADHITCDKIAEKLGGAQNMTRARESASRELERLPS